MKLFYSTLIVLLLGLVPAFHAFADYDVDFTDPVSGLRMRVDLDTKTALVAYNAYEGRVPETLIIPDEVTYDNIPCKVIGITEEAFSNTSVKTLQTGVNLKFIEDKAFYGCKMLESVLMKGITTLGKKTFYGCLVLNTVEFDSSPLKTIGSECFGHCPALTGEFTIPATVSEIGANPWAWSSNIVSVNAPANPAFRTEGGVLYSNDLTRLVAYPCGLTASHFNVPGQVKTLCENSMSNTKFETITLPEGLETMDSLCLYYSRLKELTIPSTVRKIGGCMAVTSFYIDNLAVAPGNQRYKVTDGFLLTAAGDSLLLSVFRSPSRGTGTVIVPEGVMHIGEQSFYMMNLTSLKLPSTAKSVGRSAFCNCLKLQEVDFGSSLESIGAYAFENCKFETVSLPPSMRHINEGAFAHNKYLTTLNLNDGLQSIRASAFQNCPSLLKVDLPGSITKWGWWIFAECPSITEATLGEGIKMVPRGMFSQCTSLKDVLLPESVVVIGSSAFYKCPVSENTINFPIGLGAIDNSAFDSTDFACVILPDNVEYMGQSAFAGCKKLHTFKAGAALKTIGVGAFASTPLKNVTFNEGLETIGWQAFASTQLESITLPASIVNIGWQAFNYIPTLSSIKILAHIPPVLDENDAFVSDEYIGNIQLWVPDGSLEDYRNAPVWRKFSNISTFDSGISGLNSEYPIPVEVRDLSGNSVSLDTPGIIIIKYNDGSIRKILNNH